MIGRLKEGDEVTFACIDGEGSTRIRGTVRERAGNYVRITVHQPHDYPSVTLETGTEYGPGITVCRDYSMGVLGHAPYVNVAGDGYETVIHAK
ncbi:hypothetical protein [Haloarcula marina]|uniref:hypothetical protein n=1 Tax=Haloarcula marina TaxID=2961574 RepID=UPI0020B77893|nr:hypothetical protein [Halomicroarcula marina]